MTRTKIILDKDWTSWAFEEMLLKLGEWCRIPFIDNSVYSLLRRGSVIMHHADAKRFLDIVTSSPLWCKDHPQLGWEQERV